MTEDKQSCLCRGRHGTMERFLRICLMLLLRESNLHGYALMDNLTKFGYAENDINISTLYRTLRKMEKQGLVASRWHSSGKGPKKRVYALTDTGKGTLSEWTEILKEKRARIDNVLQYYENNKADNRMPGEEL